MYISSVSIETLERLKRRPYFILIQELPYLSEKMIVENQLLSMPFVMC